MHGAVGDRLKLPQPRRLSWDFDNAGARSAHGFHPGIVRIDDRHPVQREIISVNVRFEWTDRRAPKAIVVRERSGTARPFARYLHLFRIGCPQTERDRSVGMDLW